MGEVKVLYKWKRVGGGMDSGSLYKWKQSKLKQSLYRLSSNVYN